MISPCTALSKCRKLPFFVTAILSLFLVSALPEAKAQDLYWTVNGPEIMGAEKDGSDSRTVFDGTGMDGNAIDVFVTADHIYWTDSVFGGGAGGGVWRADRNGENATQLISNPTSSPSTNRRAPINFTSRVTLPGFIPQIWIPGKT